VAVLNHLGAKKEAGLSTPRIFTYGKDVQFIIFLLQQHFAINKDYLNPWYMDCINTN